MYQWNFKEERKFKRVINLLKMYNSTLNLQKLVRIKKNKN